MSRYLAGTWYSVHAFGRQVAAPLPAPARQPAVSTGTSIWGRNRWAGTSVATRPRGWSLALALVGSSAADWAGIARALDGTSQRCLTAGRLRTVPADCEYEYERTIETVDSPWPDSVPVPVPVPLHVVRPLGGKDCVRLSRPDRKPRPARRTCPLLLLSSRHVIRQILTQRCHVFLPAALSL
ncbi:hypothetical protein TgHK011_007268 [Trichoderma gracile]|nr:hypothetical protein TgHK011_007268 [Trichoderma gracile]